jgi:hypothetical protein
MLAENATSGKNLKKLKKIILVSGIGAPYPLNDELKFCRMFVQFPEQ